MAHKAQAARLPLGIMTVIDLRQIARELAALDEFSFQSSIRTAGRQPALPKTSRELDELARDNSINLLAEADRQKLVAFVQELSQTAPVIHISFASEPSRAFLSQIVSWFRQQVHPQVILQVGLQPSIAAGCTIRTTNKFFDFSLRQYFSGKHQLLIDKLVEGKA